MAIAKQVQSSNFSVVASPATVMEESIEIYQLRLEHKRFLEDAEQERASNEKLREDFVAEIHRRADAEKKIRALRDENMNLRVRLERLERLERGRDVERPVSYHFSIHSVAL